MSLGCRAVGPVAGGFDELVKQNGRWLFKHRVITSNDR